MCSIGSDAIYALLTCQVYSRNSVRIVMKKRSPSLIMKTDFCVKQSFVNLLCYISCILWDMEMNSQGVIEQTNIYQVVCDLFCINIPGVFCKYFYIYFNIYNIVCVTLLVIRWYWDIFLTEFVFITFECNFICGVYVIVKSMCVYT